MPNQKEINKLRQDFPAIVNNSNCIYFDNACTTLKPISVIQAQNYYYENFPACAGRSSHKWGKLITEKIEASRAKIANFIGASQPEEIIFTKNATEGINLIANSLDFGKKNIVLTSSKEHNSNLLPWIRLAKQEKIKHLILKSTPEDEIDLQNLRQMLEEEKNVKLISIVHTSNLDGQTFPVQEIIKIAREYDILILLDATQSIPHQPINAKNLDVDFLVFSGHKMLGPTGIGVLYGKYELLEKLEPLILGGGSVNNSFFDNYEPAKIPDRFEAGIQNYAGILGLEAAIDYLNQTGFDNIQKQERELNKFLTESLRQFKNIKIIGPENSEERNGIITFIAQNRNCHEIALLLNESAGIMVRAGQFCVHSWFNSRNIKSAIRASVYFYNTTEETEIFINTLKKII